MGEHDSAYWLGHPPRLLVLEDGPDCYSLCRWLQERNTIPVPSTDVSEAAAFLGAVFFRDDAFDGLLIVGNHKSRATFAELDSLLAANPGLPAAMLLENTDASSLRWASLRRIPILFKPLAQGPFAKWLKLAAKSFSRI